MNFQPPTRTVSREESANLSLQSNSVLQVYLLGLTGFEAALALQRRLVYQISGDRKASALIICEHPPLITVGRHGSRAHILCETAELQARQWKVRWVNRGGGCLLHLPGQLAVYPILALDQFELDVPEYLARLQRVLIDVLADFQVSAQIHGSQGVWAGARPIAGVGVAVRDWVTYYGAALNVNPDLELFRLVRYGGRNAEPMTSLERERHGPVRPALVRERLLEHFQARFSFARTAVFFEHPSFGRKVSANAFASPY